MPPQMPIASGRYFVATEPTRRVSESGMIAAPPKPCTARARIGIHGSVLSAENTDAT